MNKFSTLLKLSTTVLAGLWLTGCIFSSDVEKGLTRALSRDVRVSVSRLVESVRCDAPKKELRECTVSYVRGVKLPDTTVQVAAPKDSYPTSFRVEQAWLETYSDTRYIAEVQSPLDGETMPVSEAAKLLASAMEVAADAAKAQLGETYTKRVAAYKNLSSY